MIKPGEIQQRARELGIRDQQIEKDYIISWILFGLSQHHELSRSIAFKGGTVLKKFYFPDYRFSEDLDFTLLNTQLRCPQVLAWFKETFEYVLDQSNIPLSIKANVEEGDVGINFAINYRGPLGGQGTNKRVKVDISKAEKLEFQPVLNHSFASYSDLKKYSLLCYPLEEVLIEKLRCIMQRMAARDFYDIWYLLVKLEMEVASYVKEFKTKCATKGINSSEFKSKLLARLPQYRASWKNSLEDQIFDLPDFEKVVREVQRQLRQLPF